MPRFNNENGNTLLLVIAVMAIAALLLMASLRLSDNQTLQVLGFFNREDALKHAELGYNKYLWELNQDSTFYLDSSRFIKTVDSNEKKIYQPVDQPNSDNYLVEIEIPVKLVGSEYEPVSNQVIIRSTGWTDRDPDKKRSLQVYLAKRSFAQYSMVTDNDLSPDGNPIYWTTGEKCYGPLHTNGTLYINGTPVFYGPVTYGVGINPASKASNTSIFRGGQAKTATLNWPSSNSKLLAVARTGGAGDYYLGRACIMLHPSGYDVRCWDAAANTWRYNGQAYEFEKTSDDDAYLDKGKFYFPSKAACNSIPTYTSFSQVRSAYASLDYPSNGVIYVDGSTSASYPYTTSKFNRSLGNVFVSGQLQGQLTIACSNDIFITAWDPIDWRGPWPKKDATGFGSYTYTGGVSYLSSSTDFNQIFTGGEWDHTEITGSNRDDMLGLVADNNIQILHYSWPAQLSDMSKGSHIIISNNGWTEGKVQTFPSQYDYSASGPDSAAANILIHAALFTTRGSFGYEKPDRGPSKGEITLYGSIAQHNRGVIGLIGASGYDKNYTHDPRMLYTSPPNYIEPANTGWQVGEWKEISAPVTKASS